ncbi:unnamed protein product [marine sediment metagenome]|uniref:Addiction module toxin RelE n=1 Tax=marine sediment metagenome TaxID=412755 RepID=X1KA17_9ZZZZ
MRLNYLKSYDRLFKKLTSPQQEDAIKAIDALIGFIKTGKKPEGLGLKKVRSDYWEIRLDVKNRIIFEFKSDIINFAFVGGHSEVKKFLRGKD